MKKQSMHIIVTSVIAMFTFSLICQGVFAQGQQELAYDDGVFETGATQDPPYEYGVLFSIPDTWDAAEIVKVRVYLTKATSYFRIYVYDERALPTDDSRLLTMGASGVEGWNEYPITTGLEVSGDFYVAVEINSFTYPTIGADETSPAEARSYIRASASQTWGAMKKDWGIRAVIEEVEETPGFVVPEVPFGSIIAVSASFAALIIFVKKSKK